MDICRKWSYTKKNTFQSGNIKKEKNKKSIKTIAKKIIIVYNLFELNKKKK